MSFTVFIWTLDTFSLSFSPVLVPNYVRRIFFCMFVYFVCLFLCFKSMQSTDSFEKHKTAFLHLQGDSQRVKTQHILAWFTVCPLKSEEAAFRRAADFEFLCAIPVLTTNIAFCDFTTDLAKIKEKHQRLYGTDPNLLRSYCCAADGSYRQAQKNPQFPRQHQERNKTWSVLGFLLTLA